MGEPHLINKSDDSRKDWRTVNDLIEEARRVRAELRRVSQAVEEIRRKPPAVSAGDGDTEARWS